MPRKADPNLENSILNAALKLFESGGSEAVTMREVAKAAGTTTPTLYERFKDREALFEALTDRLRNRLIAELKEDDSLEEAGRKFLAFCRQHPFVIDLLLKRIASNLQAKRKGPVYDLVCRNLVRLDRFPEEEAQSIAFATSSLMAGTAVLVRRLGPGSPAGKRLEQATLDLMRRISRSSSMNSRLTDR